MMAGVGSSSRRRRGLVTYIWDRMVGEPMSDEDYYRLTSEPGPDGEYDRSYTAAGDLEYFRRRTRGVPISTRLMFILDGMLEHEFEGADSAAAGAAPQASCQPGAPEARACQASNNQDAENQNLPPENESQNCYNIPPQYVMEPENGNLPPDDDFGNIASNLDVPSQNESHATPSGLNVPLPNDTQGSPLGQSVPSNQAAAECPPRETAALDNGMAQETAGQNLLRQNERLPSAFSRALPQHNIQHQSELQQNPPRQCGPTRREVFNTAHRISQLQNEAARRMPMLNTPGLNELHRVAERVRQSSQNDLSQNAQRQHGLFHSAQRQHELFHNAQRPNDLFQVAPRQHDLFQNVQRNYMPCLNELYQTAQRLSNAASNQNYLSQGVQRQNNSSQSAQTQNESSQGAQRQNDTSQGAQRQSDSSQSAQRQNDSSQNAQGQNDSSQGAQRQNDTSQNDWLQNAHRPYNLFQNPPRRNDWLQNAQRSNDLFQNAQRQNDWFQSAQRPNDLFQNVQRQNDLFQNAQRPNDLFQSGQRQNDLFHNAPRQNNLFQNAPRQNDLFQNAQMQNILPTFEPYANITYQALPSFVDPLGNVPYQFMPSFIEPISSAAYQSLPPIIDARSGSYQTLPFIATHQCTPHQVVTRHTHQYYPAQNIPYYYETMHYAPQQHVPYQLVARYPWSQSMPTHLEAYQTVTPQNIASAMPRPNAPRQAAATAPQTNDMSAPDLMPDDIIYPMVNAALAGSASENADLLRMLPPGLSTSDVVLLVYDNMITNGYTSESAFACDTPQAARMAARRRAARCRAAMLEHEAQQTRQSAAPESATNQNAARPPSARRTAPPDQGPNHRGQDVPQQPAATAEAQNNQSASRTGTPRHTSESASNRGAQRSQRQSAPDEQNQSAWQAPSHQQTPPEATTRQSASHPPTPNPAPAQQPSTESGQQPPTARPPTSRLIPCVFATAQNPAIEELTRRIVSRIAERLRIDLRNPQVAATIRRRSMEFDSQRAAEETLRTYYRELIEGRRPEAGNDEGTRGPRPNGRPRGRRTSNRNRNSNATTQTVSDQEADLLSISPVHGNDAPRFLSQSSGESSSEFDGEADRWSLSSQHTDDDFL